MKILQYKLWFPVLIAFLLLQSCNEWLDLYPEDALVSDEFWMSQEDVESILNNTYGVLSGDVKNLLLRGELRGDCSARV